MRIIEAAGLEKTFRTRVKPAGFRAGLRALTKPDYREIHAVKGVSFSVEEGEVLAFLGPNGAGKSTTIKMLSGILAPSAGTARVLGLDPQRDRIRLARSIGAVFGQRSQLWFHLPPADSFKLLGAIYELAPEEQRRRQAELVERFALGPCLDVPVRKLSLGERIRCELAASLLHDPRVVFLDEPTIGLDVVAKREVRTLLAEAARDYGTTVFLTSHDIGDIEKLCKRAIIIHHGEVVVDEPMKELRHRALRRKFIGVKYAHPVRFSLPGLSPVKTKLATDALAPDDAFTQARFEVDTRKHRLPELIRALVAQGEVLDLTVEDEPLENIIAAVFAARTGAEAAGAAGHYGATACSDAPTCADSARCSERKKEGGL